MKVLGVIPARGGSKGIPRKNLADVGGRPLIAYTVDAAQSSQRLTDVVLSTDCQEIASVVEAMGIEVPFMRPAELAADATPTIDVLVHLCAWMKEQDRNYDAICLLQPTSPLREDNLIDRCIERFEASGCDSLISVQKVPHEYNPAWVYWEQPDDRLELSTGGLEPIKRRQLLKPAFIRDGRIYITRFETIVSQKSLFGTSLVGFHVEEGINIDTPSDLDSFRYFMAEE